MNVTEYLAMTREEMEERRLQAIPLFLDGKSQSFVARNLSVSRTTASRWWRRWRAGDSLALRRAAGRPTKLTDEEQEKLRQVFLKLPEITNEAARDLIERMTGVRYDKDHVGRLRLKWLGKPPRVYRSRG